MSKSPFSRWRELFTNGRRSSSSSRAHHARRNLAFESLERREMLAVSALTDFNVNANTGEKPQSKVWEYNDQWYSVMPDSSGTWVWKLNGSQWSKDLQLTSTNGYQADVKVEGNLAHVFLFNGSSSRLATIEYDHGSDDRYEMWSLRPSLVNVAISSNAETAVIELDSTGRMWVAYDTSNAIEARYADVGNQYSSWSSPITVVSGIKSDDIGSIVAMPNGSIGVMASNQNSKRFEFRTHQDGTDPYLWSTVELAAGQSALNKGGGMADDHINLAVASDGTLYAAVKTSYDSSGFPRIALLVRRPSGVWDNLYQVDTVGTRPIVMINEAAGKLIVAYTQSDGGGNIFFKQSPLQNISFGTRQTLISGSVNNVTSVKVGFTDEVVALASSSGKAKGALFSFDVPAPVTNQRPVVDAGPNRTIQLSSLAVLDGTVTDDGLPSGSTTTSWTMLSGPGLVTFANAAAIDTTATFSLPGTYLLQLSASDGQLSANDTMTVVVEAPLPPPPEPTNTAPVVNAGPNRSILLGAAAALDGTITDDGLPSSPGLVTSSWTKVSGPGNVTFGNPSAIDTTATFTATGTYLLRLTASDGSLTSFDDVTVAVESSSAPITIAFQDGLFPAVTYNGTRDTKLASGSPNTNYGAATTLDLDGSPDIADLLYWDLTAIPAGSIIESASIQLNVTNTSSQAYELYVMERAWDEMAATWNLAATGSAWGTAGALSTADRGTDIVGTLTAASTGLNLTTLNAAGIAAVQAWIDGPANNFGLIIQDYVNSNGVDFSSSEASVIAQRPKLLVTYRMA